MSSGSLAELLAHWLPSQRWFAGSGAVVREIAIRSDVQLKPGDSELRQLIIDVKVGQRIVTYQVLVGLTRQLEPELGGATIGIVSDGRVAYDGAVDPRLTAVLLDGIASQRNVGPLRFRAEAGAGVDPGAVGRTLPAAASNTSIVFGDKAILKVIRRPAPGRHPDLEIPSTLARLGSTLVAPPLGWIEIPGTDQPGTDQPGGDPSGAQEPTILAILSQFFAHATDGWTLALAYLESTEPDFTAQANLLGQATGRLHAELAAAFGTAALSRAAVADMTAHMMAELTEAAEVVAELSEYQPAIMASYTQLAEMIGEIAVQRIHGDYHLGQVLSANEGWIILDFEGEPSVSLTRRRAFAPPLRDVAGMLRSFHYAARFQAGRDPGNQRLEGLAADWMNRSQDAFCVGYGEVAGQDPRRGGPLLRALLLQKAVYEAVYEARHRPGWLPIPLHAIAEAVHECDR